MVDCYLCLTPQNLIKPATEQKNLHTVYHRLSRTSSRLPSKGSLAEVCLVSGYTAASSSLYQVYRNFQANYRSLLQFKTTLNTKTQTVELANTLNHRSVGRSPCHLTTTRSKWTGISLNYRRWSNTTLNYC